MSDESYNPNRKQFIHDAPKPAAQQPFMYKKQDNPNYSLKNELNPNAEYDPLKDKPTELPPQNVRASQTTQHNTIAVNNQKVYKFCPHCGESLQS